MKGIKNVTEIEGTVDEAGTWNVHLTHTVTRTNENDTVQTGEYKVQAYGDTYAEAVQIVRYSAERYIIETGDKFFDG